MIATIAALAVGLAAQVPAQEPQLAGVPAAIEKGVAFLLGQQSPDGAWRYAYNANHDLGMTALAGLALMENGVKRDDPAIGKAEAVVREMALRSTQTYDVALAILFLARVQPGSRGANDELIRLLAERLAAGEGGGMWGYTLPVDPAKGYPTRRKRRTGSRGQGEPTEEPPDAPPSPKRPRFAGPKDNSNTQFALLGLWAAGRHEFDASPPLAAIDAHFRTSQAPQGDWGYRPGDGGGDAMTCAGLMGLAIAAARPDAAERLTAKARGARLAADPAFVKALSEVARDARQIDNRSEVYYLWSLERVCVALGLRELDGFDWYSAGARVLVSSQHPDGGWPAQSWGTLPQTCLALLFLRKANLAFELDRVLKLPARGDGAARPVAAAVAGPPAEEPGARKPGGGPGDDVSVIVRQADESKFPEITVDFEVKDPDGSPRVDAVEQDFRVVEYDTPVAITSFRGPASAEPRPTTVVLVVDHSQSMEEEDRIGGLKRAVSTFLKVIPPGSRVAVVAFGSDVKVLCPFTAEKARVQEAVDGLTPEGATRYYDAVATALELLAKESGRRAILAMTDGEDTFSQDATLDADIRAARKAGLPVHTLGLGSEDEIEVDALRRLAAETRGQYFSANDPERLRAIYEELARRLGTSYSLTYRTARPLQDGTLRPIRVSYRASTKAGVAEVFVRGMVVPATGWSRLFLALVAALALLAWLPGRLSRRSA